MPLAIHPLRSYSPVLVSLLLCSCAALPSQKTPPLTASGSSPVTQASKSPSAQVRPLTPIPADLTGYWIETQQTFKPNPAESYTAFRQRLSEQLAQGSLQL